jgi:hypothetical protein
MGAILVREDQNGVQVEMLSSTGYSFDNSELRNNLEKFVNLDE